MWWSYSPEGLRSKGTLPIKPSLIISLSIVIGIKYGPSWLPSVMVSGHGHCRGVRLVVVGYHPALKWLSVAGSPPSGLSGSTCLHHQVDGSVVVWTTPSSYLGLRQWISTIARAATSSVRVMVIVHLVRARGLPGSWPHSE